MNPSREESWAAVPDECPDFEFNLRELGGSLGDFGTLFPLAVGYIAVNGLDPAGLFVMLGLDYRLPLQPRSFL